MEPRIVFALQDDVCTLGQLAPFLPKTAVVDVTGGQLPTLEDFDGLIVSGGRMSVADTDEFPYLNDVNKLMLECIAQGKPVLAICLGIQQLAVAAGGTVDVNAPAGTERGIVEIALQGQAQNDPVLSEVWGKLGPRFLAPVSHSDAVRVPPEHSGWLASSQRYQYHAIRVGSALGLQFHPEANPTLMRTWSTEHGDPDPDRFAPQFAAHSTRLTLLAEAIATGFLNQVQQAISQ